MFHLKSLAFVTCHLVLRISAQSFFHTSLGNSGSYSSITYGSPAGKPAPQPAYSAPRPAYSAPTPGYSAPRPAYSAPPQPPAYSPPKPAYAAPPPAYSAPPPVYSAPPPAYSAPPPAYSAPPPAYSVPAPSYSAPQPRGEAPAYDNEKCTLDYQDKYAEVCVPTLKTECVNDQVKDGLKLYQAEACYTVTKSVCTEEEEVESVQVCAVAYKLTQVAAEAKLADVAWEKVCVEEKVGCAPAYGGPLPPASPGYGPPPPPPYCQQKIKVVCEQNPVLVPVVAPLNIKLPKPVDTCIIKDIVLPRVKCQKVSEKRCHHVPKVVPGESILLEKCSVSVEGESCSETVLKLPRQACIEKVKKIKTVYAES